MKNVRMLGRRNIARKGAFLRIQAMGRKKNLKAASQRDMEVGHPWRMVHRIRNFEVLRGRGFKVGPYTVKIIDPHPDNFTLRIGGAVYTEKYPPGLFSFLENALISLEAKIEEDGVRLILPAGGEPVKLSPNEKGFNLSKWNDVESMIRRIEEVREMKRAKAQAGVNDKARWWETDYWRQKEGCFVMGCRTTHGGPPVDTYELKNFNLQMVMRKLLRVVARAM